MGELRGLPQPYRVDGGSDGKESDCNARDLDSTPGSGRSPGKGNSNPLQYSCLENPMDRGVWWATVHGPHEQRVGHSLSHHSHGLGPNGKKICKNFDH